MTMFKKFNYRSKDHRAGVGSLSIHTLPEGKVRNLQQLVEAKRSSASVETGEGEEPRSATSASRKLRQAKRVNYREGAGTQVSFAEVH